MTSDHRPAPIATLSAGFILSILCGAVPAHAQSITFAPTATAPVAASARVVHVTFTPQEPPSASEGSSSAPLTAPVLAAAVSASDDQDAAPEPKKETRSFFSALGHNLIDDVTHLPRRNSIYWLAGGGAAALAVHPIDHSLNAHLQGSHAAHVFFAPGQYFDAPEQIAVGFTTYLVGRLNHQPRAQHIGMDMIEAQILAEGIVEATKYAVRRPRPLNPDGTPSTTGYSFPSGHATVTFATATVFQQHFGWKWAVPTYAIATYVASSRLHLNVHFASDVVFGAATGIIIGRSVTWHGRNDFRIAAVPMPGGIGAMITW